MADGSINNKVWRRFFILVIALLTIPILMAIYIIFTSDLSFKLGYKGINNAAEFFSAPIETIKFFITIIGILAIFMTFRQTEKQIYLTQRQNSFSNFYVHLEQFETFLKSECEKQEIPEVIHPRQLHKYIYQYEDLEIKDNAISIFDDLTNVLTPDSSKTYSKDRYLESSLLKIRELAIKIHDEDDLQYNFKLISSICDFYKILNIAIKFSPFSKKDILERTTSFNQDYDFTEATKIYEHISKKDFCLKEFKDQPNYIYYILFLYLHIKPKTTIDVKEILRTYCKPYINQYIEFACTRLAGNAEVNKIQELIILLRSIESDTKQP